MAYRGQDLNLRLGRTSARRGMAGLGEFAGAADEAARAPLRHGPIDVDETLLATCNHAYEAAVFHGSREVRLEHLVYALARVGAAQQILDDLGIQPETLRREAALAIAAEVPSAAADESIDPVTSEQLESTLRGASHRAAERGSVAGVADVLRALVVASRDTAIVGLLLRVSSDPGKLERWREDALRREPSITQVLRAAHAPDATGTIVARIEALETTLREVAAESAGARRTNHDLLRSVHDALLAMRTLLPQTAPADRTEEVKTAIDMRVQELSELVLSLDDRLHALSRAAGEPLEDMRARFDRLESRFQEQSAELARAVTPALSERLSQLMSERLGEAETLFSRFNESAPQALLEAPAPPAAPEPAPALLEKIGNMELAVRAHMQGAEEQTKTHERDLHEIYEALVKLGANQQTLANNLNTWRLDTSGDVSIVSNRLETLEANVLESLGRISAELQMLRTPIAYGEDPEAEPETGRWSFKRWLFGTNRVMSPTWQRSGRPVRKALARLRLVKK